MTYRPTKKHIIFAAIGLLLCVAIGAYIFRDTLVTRFFQPTDTRLDIGVELEQIDTTSEDMSVVAENLDIPWEIAFLPGGDMLVTERSGSLVRINGDRQQRTEIAGVSPSGEGGLLGLALHPDFSDTGWLYLYLTSENERGLINRVVRYRFESDTLSEPTTIIQNIPGASYHDGGRIAFGPDGLLYITTGDAGNSDLAQDQDSLAGKTLRLRDDGSIPDDNPFGSAVYSYGHRNAQGLAWDDSGDLWQTEHGRSGRLSGFDELNRINAGDNYGWPVIEGDESRSGMQQPIAHSGADETWAPAGLAYLDGSFYFAGLRGESLYQAQILEDGSVDITAHLRQDFGRLRAVTVGPDGFLYVSTSNTDGRGSAQNNDDRIIRLNPALFTN